MFCRYNVDGYRYLAQKNNSSLELDYKDILKLGSCTLFFCCEKQIEMSWFATHKNKDTSSMVIIHCVGKCV